MPTPETRATIVEWLTQTFGPVILQRAIARAAEELAELVELSARGVYTNAELAEEAADVFITLCPVAAALNVEIDDQARINIADSQPVSNVVGRISKWFAYMATDAISARPTAGFHLQECVTRLATLCASVREPLVLAVDAKMEVNRARTWSLDGAGCGYHVEPGAAA